MATASTVVPAMLQEFDRWAASFGIRAETIVEVDGLRRFLRTTWIGSVSALRRSRFYPPCWRTPLGTGAFVFPYGVPVWHRVIDGAIHVDGKQFEAIVDTEVPLSTSFPGCGVEHVEYADREFYYGTSDALRAAGIWGRFPPRRGFISSDRYDYPGQAWWLRRLPMNTWILSRETTNGMRLRIEEYIDFAQRSFSSAHSQAKIAQLKRALQTGAKLEEAKGDDAFSGFMSRLLSQPDARGSA